MNDTDLKKCPVCKSEKLEEVTKKRLFSSVKELICKNCGAVFVRDGGMYKLVKVKDRANPIWIEYGNRFLTAREWNNIANGGMSDEKQREVDISKWILLVEKGHVPKIIKDPSPVVLRRNEELIMSFSGISYWETRKVRKTTGGYAGPSFRIAKGVYFRVGKFDATSRSYEELRRIDTGNLTITNRRFVFTGRFRTIAIPLGKIVSVKPIEGGVEIARENRVKSIYFTGINETAVDINVDGRRYIEPLSETVFTYILRNLIKNSA
ncbi:MAG: hypothetical protein J7L03_05970 [Caldisericaceae bacterium]|nr:hypothetical protein [Caldisericaceae bacterium]